MEAIADRERHEWRAGALARIGDVAGPLRRGRSGPRAVHRAAAQILCEQARAACAPAGAGAGGAVDFGQCEWRARHLDAGRTQRSRRPLGDDDLPQGRGVDGIGEDQARPGEFVEVHDDDAAAGDSAGHGFACARTATAPARVRSVRA
ncbi:MAG TPA: hypothetical protein VLB47_15645, partial [Solirubrobacteraceae bacterium]|nr:hypothetical protein [Solirubrobacteraceae bacterium]